MSGEFLTDQQLADELNLTRGFVQAKVRAKAWPHLRIGRSIRFTPEHVAQIAALHEVAPSKAAKAANDWGRPT